MALSDNEPDLVSAVAAAACRPEVGAAVTSLYQEVTREIDQRRPRCDLSGRCCHFEAYGHRLYVTTLELAAFAGQLDQSDGRFIGWDGSGCPFQVGKLCGVHPIRPFGCRIYFCDPSAQEWQNGAYERFHSRLKELHGTFDVPYFYVEWRVALTLLGLATRLPLGEA